MDPVIPGQPAPAAPPGLPGAFTPGQVLSARVVQALSADTYLVAVRGMTLVAASETALTPDAVVRLVVQGGGGDQPVRVALAPTLPTVVVPAASTPADHPAAVVARLGLPADPIAEQVVAAFQRQGAPLAQATVRQAVRLLQAAMAPLEAREPNAPSADEPSDASSSDPAPGGSRSTTSGSASPARTASPGSASLPTPGIADGGQARIGGPSPGNTVRAPIATAVAPGSPEPDESEPHEPPASSVSSVTPAAARSGQPPRAESGVPFRASIATAAVPGAQPPTASGAPRAPDALSNDARRIGFPPAAPAASTPVTPSAAPSSGEQDPVTAARASSIRNAYLGLKPLAVPSAAIRPVPTSRSVAAAAVPPPASTTGEASAPTATPEEASTEPSAAQLPRARTEVRVPTTRFQRTWSAPADAGRPPSAATVRAAAALPQPVAMEAVARLAASPLPSTPATIPLAVRSLAGLPRLAAVLPERADAAVPLPARSTIDLAQAGPRPAIDAALRLAGIRPAADGATGDATADAIGEAVLLHRLVRLAIQLGQRGSAPAAPTDVARNPGSAAADPTPAAAAGAHRPSAPPVDLPSAELRAAASVDAPLEPPRTTEAAMQAVRESAAQDVLPPKDLADYDRVVALPLAVQGQPLPVRLAVTSRRTPSGGLACWMRVDCQLSRLGAVSVRLGAVDAGPVAITLFASPAAGAVLAEALPALAEDLRAQGVDAALRVVEEQP